MTAHTTSRYRIDLICMGIFVVALILGIVSLTSEATWSAALLCALCLGSIAMSGFQMRQRVRHKASQDAREALAGREESA